MYQQGDEASLTTHFYGGDDKGVTHRSHAAAYLRPLCYAHAFDLGPEYLGLCVHGVAVQRLVFPYIQLYVWKADSFRENQFS